MLNLLLAFCLFLSGASSSSHTSASIEGGSALASSGKTDGPLSGLLIAVNDLNLSEENVEDNYLETAPEPKAEKTPASEDRIAHLNDLKEELGHDYNNSAPVGCGPIARRCSPVARQCHPVARRCHPAPMARRCTASAPVGCGPMVRRCSPVARRCGPNIRSCGPIARVDEDEALSSRNVDLDTEVPTQREARELNTSGNLW